MEALKHILTNIFNLAPQNTSVLVWLGIAGIWLLVYIGLVNDIFANKQTSLITKVAWFLTITGIPIAGGFFYGVRGMFSADWSATLGGLLSPKPPSKQGPKKKQRTAKHS